MKSVAVLFGGRSVEHDVSIVTGLQILENMDRSKYDAFPVYISREGGWFIGGALLKTDFYHAFKSDDKSIRQVYLLPNPDGKGLCAPQGMFQKLSLVKKVDIAVLAMHGMNGEDGTLQGLLELADIPYTSAGVLGSAVGMDKILMKEAFRGMGLPVLDSVSFHRDALKENREELLASAEALGYPLFVKPANLGSSIGITKAGSRGELERALAIASGFDRRILIEKGVENPVEINCACIGYGDEALPSLCEQPVSWAEFLTFEEKYLRGGKHGGKGMKSLNRKIPAPIAPELAERVQAMTVRIFKATDCKGVVRVDYIFDETAGMLYVNEINTIPGSFAYYLYEPMGVSFSQLIDRLIAYAQRAQEDKRRSSYAYDSAILQKARFGGKTGKGS